MKKLIRTPEITNLKLCAGILYFIVIAALVNAQTENGSMRRFGIFIGSNNGGRDRAMLRYAVSDARAISKVFSEMGGINDNDGILLIEPTVREINTRIDALREQVIRSGGIYKRTEIVVYYSGHSDEEGLLLNRERYTYRELRDRINGIPSDMRIVILDSCASGAFTRLKGGAKTQPFLFDNSLSAEGYAFLTSSSADESSQESDSISASYFTHSLVAGLRGAADSVGDGRVTLNELYRFAYSATLSMTETSMYGAQHPSYDIQVSGTGDLVLTDIKETSAGIVFDEKILGRLSIRDSSGYLIAEINKTSFRPLELGLEPGLYRVTLQQGEALFQGEYTLIENTRSVIGMSDFTAIKALPSRSRGDDDIASIEKPVFIQTEEKHTDEKMPSTSGSLYTFFVNKVDGQFQFPLIGMINIAAGDHNIFQFGLANINTGNFSGFQASFINTIGKNLNGVQAAFVNTAGGETRGVQAGFVNTTGKDISGAQFGFINTAAGETRGVQASFINTTMALTGVQAGFVNSSAKEEASGAQFGFINTAAGSVQGAQAGFVNIAANSVLGVQAGFVNIAANSVQGAQAGFINIARKNIKGSQIGFLNYAESIENGIPIGFISIVKHGAYRAIEYSVSEYHPVIVGFKIGIEKFYTSILAAYNPTGDFNNVSERFALGYGFGMLSPLNKFIYFNLEINHMDIIGSWRYYGSSQSLSSVNPLFGFSLGRFSITLGPSITFAYLYNGIKNDALKNPLFKIYSFEDDKFGFVLGARVGLRVRL